MLGRKKNTSLRGQSGCRASAGRHRTTSGPRTWWPRGGPQTTSGPCWGSGSANSSGVRVRKRGVSWPVAASARLRRTVRNASAGSAGSGGSHPNSTGRRPASCCAWTSRKASNRAARFPLRASRGVPKELRGPHRRRGAARGRGAAALPRWSRWRRSPEPDGRDRRDPHVEPLGAGAGGGRRVVFVVDRRSLTTGEGRHAFRAAADFIDRLHPLDRIALYSVWSSPARISFTSDHQRVRDEVARRSC